MNDHRIYLAGGAISIIGTCTLACKHCYSNSSPSIKDVLNLPQITSILDGLRNHSINHIFFGGGEPLLHPDLASCVRHAKETGMTISISTNGGLVDRTRLQELKDAGVSYEISISLDGPSIIVNDEIRGNGSFLTALRGMYECHAFNEMLWGVNYVSCRLNLGYALKTALLAKRMGASYFNLIRVTPFGRSKFFGQKLLISPEEFAQEDNEVGSHFSKIGDFYGDIYLYDLCGSFGSESSYFNDARFHDLPSGLSIDTRGNVELTPAKIPLGNCLEKDLGDIISSLSTPEIYHQYQLWLSNEKKGVHQPRFPIVSKT